MKEVAHTTETAVTTGHGHLLFSLILPDKTLYQGMVAMAILPALAGDMAILHGHAPVIATLNAGLVTIYSDTDSKIIGSFFVINGVADISCDRIVLLADSGCDISDISDIKKWQARLQREESSLGKAQSDAERFTLQQRVDALRQNFNIP